MLLTISAQDKIAATISANNEIEAKAYIDGKYVATTPPKHAQIIKNSCGKGNGKSIFDTRGK